MTLIKENKGVRKEIPDRMMSATFALPIDERRVVGILDYIASDTGITPMVDVRPRPMANEMDNITAQQDTADAHGRGRRQRGAPGRPDPRQQRQSLHHLRHGVWWHLIKSQAVYHPL